MAEAKVVTSVALPRSTMDLLRLAAMDRALRTGGRVSASAVITELVESRRGELLPAVMAMQPETRR